MPQNPGVLYIVATPIGNLEDMSFRAIETLKSVARIAAEDTRHSASLLQRFDIRTPLIALHEFNESQRADTLLAHLTQGESLALISDAGTPLISDPGYHLVKKARQHNIRIVPIPGPCAAIAALSVAGLPTDQFIFEGFLPAKTKARTDRLTALVDEPRTIVLYEAPHRITDLLEDMEKVFGSEREVVMARELTKMFETLLSGPLGEVKNKVETDPNQQRGEIVVLIHGAKSRQNSTETQQILQLLLEELPLKKAVEIAAKITQEKRNDLYEQALALKQSKP